MAYDSATTGRIAWRTQSTRRPSAPSSRASAPSIPITGSQPSPVRPKARDEQQAGDERGRREGGEREPRQDPVGRTLTTQRPERAERDAEQHGQHERGQRQRPGHRQAPRDLVRDAHAGALDLLPQVEREEAAPRIAPAAAEPRVAVREQVEGADAVQELHGQRPVEAVRALDRRAPLGLRGGPERVALDRRAEHRVDRVTGRGVHRQEREQRDPEQRRHGPEEAPGGDSASLGVVPAPEEVARADLRSLEAEHVAPQREAVGHVVEEQERLQLVQAAVQRVPQAGRVRPRRPRGG